MKKILLYEDIVYRMQSNSGTTTATTISTPAYTQLGYEFEGEAFRGRSMINMSVWDDGPVATLTSTSDGPDDGIDQIVIGRTDWSSDKDNVYWPGMLGIQLQSISGTTSATTLSTPSALSIARQFEGGESDWNWSVILPLEGSPTQTFYSLNGVDNSSYINHAFDSTDNFPKQELTHYDGVITGTTLLSSNSLIMSRKTDENYEKLAELNYNSSNNEIGLKLTHISGTTRARTSLEPSSLNMRVTRAGNRFDSLYINNMTDIDGAIDFTLVSTNGALSATTLLSTTDLIIDSNDGVTHKRSSIGVEGITTTGVITAESIDVVGVGADPYTVTTASGAFTWDVSGTSSNYEVELQAASNTVNLTNVLNGATGVLIIKQDATGNRLLSPGTVNGAATTSLVVNGGDGILTLTSNANATDIASFTYNGTSLYWTLGGDYT